jgi:asparagine synthase (glutamine-hydrolysing)
LITFNGEIYNYRELREILARDGVAFRSSSDTEVLLAAYESWGADMLSRLNGMFAFAIWDPAKREMLVARDRLGIKPLYYYTRDGCFVCASELKAIMAYPAFRAELDRSALRQYLVRGYVPSPQAIFRDVHKLPPGHVLRVRPGQPVEVRRYWDPVPHYDASSTRGARQAEALAELDALLQEAVRYRMISDVPLGALLSGGIDSSLVVALMQERTRRPVETFTIAFDVPSYDESPYAAAVARYLGTDHHELLVSERNLLELIPSLTRYYDEPFADMSAIPTYAVSRLARQHVTVALSGDGGDETHVGYSTYQWMSTREQIHRWLPRRLIGAGAGLGGRLPHRRVRRTSRYLSFEDDLEAHRWAVSYWPWGEAQRLLNGRADGALPSTAYEHTADRLQDLKLLERMAAADLTSYMIDDILTKVDRASMAVALEVRVPLLDHRVVEFVAGLPLDLKFRRGKGKHLLRQLLYQRVPRELVDRPKHGFTVPMATWLRGPLKDLLLTMTSSDALTAHGLFREDVVARHTREHLSGKRDHTKKLWSLLMFQMWYDRYLK